MTPLYANLTADEGPTEIEGILPGQEFSVWIPSGATFGSGTLTILGDADGAGDEQVIPGASFTAGDEHKVFVNPSANGRIYYELSGATSPDIDLHIVPVISERG